MTFCLLLPDNQRLLRCVLVGRNCSRVAVSCVLWALCVATQPQEGTDLQCVQAHSVVHVQTSQLMPRQHSKNDTHEVHAQYI